MQIVIDIPNDHKRIIDNLVIDGKLYLLPNEVEDTLAKAVKVGTPLPKGHGRLIDADKLKHAFIKWSMAVQGSFTDNDIASIVYNSPTIVEADKAQERREK